MQLRPPKPLECRPRDSKALQKLSQARTGNLMPVIQIKRGLDIPVQGSVSNFAVADAWEAPHAALLPVEVVGIKTKLLVKEGDAVQVGTPLFLDRRDETVLFTSPSSGKIKAIHRGQRRMVLAVVIERDGNDSQIEENTKAPSKQDPAALRDTLCRTGLWTALRQRPFGRIAQSGDSPAALFITGTDSRPLAVSPHTLVANRQDEFVAGAQALASLTEGPTWLCTNPNDDWSDFIAPGIQQQEFSGPHPSGLPGTHMHQLGPAGTKQILWQIGAVDVADIGEFLLSGKQTVRRTVAVTGPAATKPRLLRTWNGMGMEFATQEEQSVEAIRVVSGSLLDGRTANTGTPEGFLGRWDSQISIVSEQTRREMLAWMFPFGGRHTLTNTLLDKFFRSKFKYDADLNGSPRAIVPIGSWEEINALDILPTQLIKSLASGDIETAEKLGALELVEEDVALWEYACPSKSPITRWLRNTLSQIEKEG
ncbi:MAG TPA: NADH:ubiquinone reductase (Na(+)-transporting) subunit A [Planctomycetes bacterium]|nr:NADH:ubiquinone reductase (Na(+)-transporting) subunit A [Planctomycetota bacterium]